MWSISNTCLFGVRSWSTPNRITINYRYPYFCCVGTRYVYLRYVLHVAGDICETAIHGIQRSARYLMPPSGGLLDAGLVADPLVDKLKIMCPTCMQRVNISHLGLMWSPRFVWVVLPPLQNDCPISQIFFLGSKWLSSLSARLEMWASKSKEKITPNFYHQEVFRQRNFGGRFGVVVVFYFKSHTYNYSVNGQHALISPKLGTRTIVLGGSIGQGLW